VGLNTGSIFPTWRDRPFFNRIWDYFFSIFQNYEIRHFPFLAEVCALVSAFLVTKMFEICLFIKIL